MQYIGMDTHISNLDFAVVNDAGRLMKATSVATSVKNFMEFVRKVPPPRIIYMEEGTLAGWALEICAHFGEKLIITDPKENHWIGSSGQKNDPLDALKLAQLARGGYINAILLVGGIPQALWWFPFIYIGICIVGMLAYEATGPKGAPQAGSLLTMCVIIECSLVLFGVMGTVGVSGMIPLWSAIMFIFPAIALILARKHAGWG
jgi:hypothetical protein